MDQEDWILMLRRPVRREGSGQYMVFVLVSFAVSVSLTRLFLYLSNYPQIASGELHIAHVLWGGLLLFIAALLPLLMSNRRAYKAAAILAGIGIGLFIDEVGKFITQKNDYFYPAAAPIIYIFFMLTLILLLQLRRPETPTTRAELSKALDILQDWIYYPLNSREQQVLLERLQAICQNDRSELLAGLAQGILSVVEQDARPAPPERPPRWRQYTAGIDRLVSERSLRTALGVGFLAMALIALKNPAGTLFGSSLPPFVNEWFLGFHSGRWFTGDSAAMLYRVRVVLEVVLGSLALLTGLLFFLRRPKVAVPLGFGLLLIYLGTVNMFLFYFEQFSTVLLLSYQFILLLGLIYYRSRFPPGVQKTADTENLQPALQ